MRFPRLRLINKSQKGFTLIELILVIAIGSIIGGSVTVTMFQVFTGSARTNNHMIAVRQVQNAGYWVSYDVKMAQSAPIIGDDLGTPAVEEFLTVTWSEWGGGGTHQVVYTLEDMPSGGGLKQLVRNHSVNGTTDTGIIAQFVDVTVKDGKAQTRCEPADGALVFTVTATVGGGLGKETETRVYEIVPRPGS
jgi:prepilin-type N-terminal cleavage/methylation domain-containing protein